MDATTAVTLATGQRFIVRGTYEDIDAKLAARRLSQDDGKRELLTAEGTRLRVLAGAAIAIEELSDAGGRKQACGFR